MARVFVTGSTDGLGLMAARLLADNGHAVSLHARNETWAADARAALPGAEAVVVGDFADIAAVRGVAEQANAVGRYDAVIHNAGVGPREPSRIATVDGLSHVFAVNAVAPHLLTASMTPSDRLVFLSSGTHRRGDADLADLQWERRPWDGGQAYDASAKVSSAGLWVSADSAATAYSAKPPFSARLSPYDLVTGSEPSDALADDVDPPGEVRAERLVRRRAQPAQARIQRRAAQTLPVTEVDRCGGNRDEHVPGGGRRHRHVVNPQHIGRSIPVVDDRPHVRPPAAAMAHRPTKRNISEEPGDISQPWTRPRSMSPDSQPAGIRPTGAGSFPDNRSSRVPTRRTTPGRCR